MIDWTSLDRLIACLRHGDLDYADENYLAYVEVQLMKRKNQNPKVYSEQHCKERALERYGFELSSNDYDSLTQKLRNDMTARCFPKDTSKFKLVAQEGAQVTLVIPLREHKLVAVFDMDSGILKTLLPPDQFEDSLKF